MFGDCTHGPLLSSGADPEAALAIFGEATGSGGDHVKAEESLCDHNNVFLTAPEFDQNYKVL